MEEKTAQEKITIGSEVGIKVNCSMCQKEGATDQFTTLQSDEGKNIYLCADCKQKTNTAFEEETKNPNLVLGIIGGGIGGAIGGIVWYVVAIVTGIEIGYLSLGLAIDNNKLLP